MGNLQQTIQKQSLLFAQRIIEALRSASIDELVDMPRGGRAPREARPAHTAVVSSGRIRRSAADIQSTLEKIVALVGNEAEGLRAEVIREQLGLDKREMPK